MGAQISFDENPLGSIVLGIMMSMKEGVVTDGAKNLIKLKCGSELNETLINQLQLIYLDFDLKFDKFGDKCEIIPNNIITALWFCGIYPIDADEVILENKFHYDLGYYNFNEKTKKLKFFNISK